MQHLFIKLFVSIFILRFKSNFLIREQHEVMNQDLSSLFQGIGGIDRTIGLDVKNQTFIVSFSFYTVILNLVFHVFNRRVNSINRNYTNLSICRHIL